MKDFINKFWPILLILGLTILVAWPTFLSGYFSHHDDLQVMRVFEIRKCIEDFQIPCRWVPDMGYGNGYPLFNYYAPLPYYLGAAFSFIVGFLTASKLLFAIPLFLGAISMYFLANELFGKYPGVLAAILYTFAPYRALDTFVRGDVTENFAIAIVPLIVYFALKLIRKNDIKYMIGLSVSSAIFLTSHNIMTVLFSPVIFLLSLYFLQQEKWKNLLPLLFSFLIGIGLAAFFIFPAYFEKNLVQIDNLIKLDLNFRAHFVTVNQLFFDRFWGWGASSPGTNDTISFQIGWPHWWIVVAAGIMILVNILHKKKKDWLPLIIFCVFLFSIFMTHIKSAFIWEKIEILKFTQFPWRFLSIAAFTASLLGAYLMQNFKDSYKKYLVAALIILTIGLNFQFFKPKEFFFDMTDQKKLSGKFWEDQQKAAILDYLPQTAVQPRESAPAEPIVVAGKATVENFEKKSNRWQFQVKVVDSANIEVPIFDFPIWKVWVNGKQINFSNEGNLLSFGNKNYLGRISINLPKTGEYEVYGKFTDTPIRKISNTVSIISLGILLLIIFYGKFKKNFR